MVAAEDGQQAVTAGDLAVFEFVADRVDLDAEEEAVGEGFGIEGIEGVFGRVAVLLSHDDRMVSGGAGFDPVVIRRQAEVIFALAVGAGEEALDVDVPLAPEGQDLAGLKEGGFFGGQGNDPGRLIETVPVDLMELVILRYGRDPVIERLNARKALIVWDRDFLL